MTGVADRDLLQVMEVLDAARAPQPDSGRLPTPVLAALHALVPSDDVTFLDLDVATTTIHVEDEYDGDRLSSLPEPEQEPDAPFWQHYAGSRFCSYPSDTGDDRTVTTRGDFFTWREWQRTPMYVDVFAADGVTDELMCTLTSRGARSRRLLFVRCGGRDFDERDRLLMALLRPHLAEVVAVPPLPTATSTEQLTARQAELLRLVAAGRTNAQIAAELFVSPHTVRKHLENIFDRLGVTTRTAAVARAFG
jgi:DNA-binding CsgD family transcriptional regulator